MHLTPHFTLQELTASQTAAHRGIDNRPNIQETRNLTRLAETLEQVRALVGRAVLVSSGYRSQALNKAIGGSATSAHMRGLAADFSCNGITPVELARRIAASDIVFDQLIFEGTWVHLGLSAGKPRREVLTAHFGGGRTAYTKGLPLSTTKEIA
ncbi:D-Ala-D-Ala carboxypeptidase family metallohydrolase [Massilia sp. NP310]|uniref:D-Ala-D-Ala carboxypeptidase family metallohydrolase n=1 Tax=Massilia sp. NP310 TaxID=2861282 RepID=UPI001C62F792|nr:D-Ala-D-Ala carboxypeptidase family metallohydrolase [Massilia sp. NP310]QYG03899.1 peptidase M15 [Massilia sp. NP310]